MNERDRLANCFAAVFPALSPRDIPRADTDRVAEWDSMATVTLVAVVEEEFGVSFAPDEIERLTSFAAFERRLANR